VTLSSLPLLKQIQPRTRITSNFGPPSFKTTYTAAS
jgi:hypothetical protein